MSIIDSAYHPERHPDYDVVHHQDTYAVQVGSAWVGVWFVGIHGTAAECAAYAHRYRRVLMGQA